RTVACFIETAAHTCGHRGSGRQSAEGWNLLACLVSVAAAEYGDYGESVCIRSQRRVLEHPVASANPSGTHHSRWNAGSGGYAQPARPGILPIRDAGWQHAFFAQADRSIAGGNAFTF